MKTFTLLITTFDAFNRHDIRRQVEHELPPDALLDVVEGDHLAIDYCNSDDSYRQIKRAHRDLRLAQQRQDADTPAAPGAVLQGEHVLHCGQGR